jgi:siroheme synthase
MPAIAIENASLPGQTVHEATIASLPKIIAAARLTGPVLLLIGEALSGPNATRDVLSVVAA